MNKLLLVVTFAAGAGVGFYAAHKYLDESYKEFYEGILDEEMEIYRERMSEKNEEIPTPERTSKHDYSNIVDQYKKPELSELVDGNELFDDDENEEENHDVIEYIDEYDFFQDQEFKEYDKITFMYYDEDGALVDSSGEIVMDSQEVLGADPAEIIDPDTDIGYVRNHRLSSDFEIVGGNGSYSVEVLGLDD